VEWSCEEVRGFYDYLVLKGRSRDTAYQNTRYAHLFAQWLGKPVRETTRDDVMAFLRYLREERGYSDSTLRVVCYSLTQFLRYLGMRDLAEWVPRPFPRPREIEWLPEDVVYDVIDDDPYLVVAYELALRVSELLLLRRDEYDPETGTIAVYRLKHKSAPNRYLLRLSEHGREVLNRYLEEVMCPGNLVFCVSRRAIQQRFKRALARAGLDPSRYTFHVLRHSRCTHLVMKQLREKGVADLVTLSKFLGHLDPRTTLRYVHIASRALGIEIPLTV
jgi:integrase